MDIGKRVPGRKSMKKKMKVPGGKRPPVTEEELQNAINKFLKSGGVIQKLPDEKSVSGQKVGAKWGHADFGNESQQ